MRDAVQENQNKGVSLSLSQYSSDPAPLAPRPAPCPQIMGILNMTPDSFFDGGRYFDAKQALERLNALVDEGARIIDIGGESSRPGSQRIGVEEEMARVRPALETISQIQEKTKNLVLFSIDTTKSEVARFALECGASIINDISAWRFDPEGMIALMRDFSNSKLVLMHMLGQPKTMQDNPTYHDVIESVGGFFEERLSFLERHGISRERVVLDPGIGFGKSLEHNLTLLRNIGKFKERLGLPLLVGASRKSMIGAVLGGVSADFRLEGSLAVALWCAGQSVDYIRVHDVAQTMKALAVWKAIGGSNDGI